MKKVTKQDLLDAKNKTINDVIAPNLNVLFCGINPGLWSGATGNHFAKSGNRFWKAIHLAGFTPTLLKPFEEQTLLEFGYGITNVVARTTATAAEIERDEYVTGGANLRNRVLKYEPKILAILGIGAYRVAFDKPKAVLGLQTETIATTKIWVLPNPSGLNAHYQLADLAKVYGELRESSL
ncbi:MAG: G/U mismatch-specific DNA glycosylase [Pyrinomonadaceae bacterium]|nr:G/U mismatch-specific DNA glycosylase [Pyrinomonadaceae bacterium]